MVNRIKALCMVPEPYPDWKIREPNLAYARLLSVPYAGQGGELSSILQYLYGKTVCKGRKPAMLSDIFSYIAETEMHHLEILGALVRDFGGAPKFQSDRRNVFSAAGLEYDTNPDRLLAAAWKAEQRAAADYRRLAGQIREESVSRMLQRLLMDEEHHEKIFRELMSDAV